MTDATLIVLAALLLILTLAPLSRRKEWWVRGWEFPRLQLAALCAALTAAGLVRLGAAGPAGWIPVLLPLACLAWHVGWILPFTPLRRREVADAGPAAEGDTIRLLVANVRMQNRETERLVRLVRKEAPDILLALETDAFWGGRLAPLKDALPHAVEHPRDNTFGMHLLSRFPLEEAEVRFLIEEDVPSIHCRVALPSGARLRLYCVHPAPPSPTENEESTERDAELVMVGRMAAECGEPAIVAGDLNDVAWSRTTRRFRRIAGLLDPRIGRGLFNTFHAKLPMLRWPLDHIFHSPEFRLVRLRRMPAIGSDHFPMLVELALDGERRR